MKVALSGSHATGKTTLCKYIHDTYSLPILKEKARFLMETKFPFDRLEEDLSFFIDFQLDVLAAQLKDEYSNEEFVADRPLIDSVVYLKERFIKERFEGYSFFEKYRKIAIEGMNNYDLIFFVRVQDSLLEEDGFRNINKFYVKAIDELIFLEYSKLGLKNVIEINTDNLEERKFIIDSTFAERRKI